MISLKGSACCAVGKGADAAPADSINANHKGSVWTGAIMFPALVL
jgi:hypothetical protein